MSVVDSSPVRTPKRVRVEGVPNLYMRPKDGRYEHGFTGPEGRWHVVTLKARNKTEAKLELADRVSKLGRDELAAPARTTFAEAWQDFERTFASLVSTGEKSERTLELYRQRWRTHLEPSLGRLPIQKVSPQRVAALFAELRKKGLSPWTLRGVWTLLGSIFNHAQTRGLIYESPLQRISKSERPTGKSRKKPRALTDAECRKLIQEAPGGWGALVATAIFTGLRISELLALRWQDVDFEAGVLRVRIQLSRASGDNAARLVRLKTGAGERDVYLLPELAHLLRGRKADAFRFGHARPDGFVFGTQEGKPLSQRNAHRAVSLAAERVGVKASMHDLRHTAISRLIAAGLDVVQVQRQAGHARPSITLDIYSHEFERAKRSEDVRAKIAATGIGAVLSGQS